MKYRNLTAGNIGEFMRLSQEQVLDIDLLDRDIKLLSMWHGKPSDYFDSMNFAEINEHRKELYKLLTEYPNSRYEPVFKVTTSAGISPMIPNSFPKNINVPPTTAAAKTNTFLISLIFLSILKDNDNINASQAFCKKSFKKVYRYCSNNSMPGSLANANSAPLTNWRALSLVTPISSAIWSMHCGYSNPMP